MATTQPIKKPITQEIATRARDFINPPLDGMLRSTDATLAARGGHLGIRIYEKLENDPTVYAALQKRYWSVISREWQVDAASDDPQDQKAAELVRQQLEAINFDDACLQMLDAILKGYSVTEIMWALRDGQWTVDKLISRNQARFAFAEDGSLRLLTQSNMLRGEELSDKKFIVHSFGSKDGNPYGLGLGSRLFWWVWFKRQVTEFWLAFSEKYGSPLPVGTYPDGTPEAEQNKLLEALLQFAQEAAMVKKEGEIVELLEATRTGSRDAYEALIRYCDEMILQIILGEANSSRESGGALAAASMIRNEVRLELSRGDSDLLHNILNRTLIKWIVEFNLPGARPPRVWRKIEADEDLRMRAYRDRSLFGMGFLPSEQYITDTYGGDWKFTPALLQSGGDSGGGDMPAFAAPKRVLPQAPKAAEQEAMDEFVAALPAAALNEQSRQMLEPIIKAIMSGTTYEAAMFALDEALPDIDTRTLETALGKAIFVAEVFGGAKEK